MGKIVIKLKNISKKYELVGAKPTFVEFLLSRDRKTHWALRDIDLVFEKGEKVGIIGPNGAGKTTLLSIVSEIVSPTSGELEVCGKVVSLIGLEAGFHPDLTGIENIYLNGFIVGMNKLEITKQLEKIISFADIGKYIDYPMYSYSQGMKLRIGFSVAINANFDTLVLDENISVGDEDFQQKSLKKIKSVFARGKTVIIATHHLDFIKKTCNRVIWLDEGRIIKDGSTNKIISEYEKANR